MAFAHYQRKLEMPDPYDRMAALEALYSRQDATSFLVQSASRLLSDNDPGVREYAAHILVEHPTAETAKLTAPYIASENIAVRNLAGDILAKIGDAAVRVLAPYLNHANQDVRKFAIDVLALLPAGELAPQIARRLTDSDMNVVLSAIDALGALNADQYADDLRWFYDRKPLTRPNVVAAIGGFSGSENLACLERALRDENPVVVLTAAEQLAKHSTPRVLRLLMRQVDHVQPLARAIVLHSISGMLDAFPDVALSLPAELKGHFLEMLDDLDPDYVRAAVRGIRNFLDAESIGIVLAHAGNDDNVDLEIFNLIQTLPDAFAYIEEAIDKEFLAIPTATGFVLGLLARQSITYDVMPAVSQFLDTYFDVLDAEVKIAAINLSQQLQQEILYNVIHAGLRDPDPTVNSFACNAASDLNIDISSEAHAFRQ